MNKALTPRKIVEELDRYIVGQAAAKRAVAIALRNRWRRQQVSDDLRDEIHPKNIILIGPTGVGKTEIARRLAKLAQAPFVKVEASKFTEVGYVGRDVESMIRDLVEASIALVRDEEKKWGIPILVDLKGTLGAEPWNLPTKTSSVLLLDSQGALVYRYSGRMKEEDQKTFFQTLGALLGREIPEESHP